MTPCVDLIWSIRKGLEKDPLRTKFSPFLSVCTFTLRQYSNCKATGKWFDALCYDISHNFLGSCYEGTTVEGIHTELRLALAKTRNFRSHMSFPVDVLQTGTSRRWVSATFQSSTSSQLVLVFRLACFACGCLFTGLIPHSPHPIPLP